MLFDTTNLRFWGTTDINARFFMKGPHFDASWPFRFDSCVPFGSRYLHTEIFISTCISQWSYITRFGWYLQRSHIHMYTERSSMEHSGFTPPTYICLVSLCVVAGCDVLCGVTDWVTTLCVPDGLDTTLT